MEHCFRLKSWNLPCAELGEAEEDLLEGGAEGAVDEEVGGGVEHQGQLVEAGQAEEPGGGGVEEEQEKEQEVEE